MTGMEIALVAATGLSVLQGVAQGNAQQAQIEGEKTATETNAAINESNSYSAEIAARRDAYIRAGADIAGAAALGRGQTGSILDLMADSTSQEELNILGIRNSSKIDALAAKSKISSLNASSSASKTASLLGGASKLASGYASYKINTQSLNATKGTK